MTLAALPSLISPTPFHLEDEEVWPQLFLRQQACGDVRLGVGGVRTY